jgi:[acyl-carrier-protein] S-malonyltransferase
MFPGQGTQFVGMGRELHDAFDSAREVWATVDDALGESLSSLAFSGDAAELCLTRNAQPAILATSIAALRCAEQLGGLPQTRGDDDTAAVTVSCALGHSLGEYTALVASGVVSLDNAIRAARFRGDVMQHAASEFCDTYRASAPDRAAASDDCIIGMSALLKFQTSRVDEFSVELERRLTTQHDNTEVGASARLVCQVANINSDGQVVLSGSRAGVEIGIELAKTSYGARRAVWLPVSAPFHCPIMQPAAERLRGWLEEQGPDFWSLTAAPAAVSQALVPVICNVTAAPLDTSNTTAMIDSLAQQVTAPVRWSDSVRGCVDADESLGALVEFGGSVLGPLVRQTTTTTTGNDRNTLQTFSVTSPADIEGLAEQLSKL